MTPIQLLMQEIEALRLAINDPEAREDYLDDFAHNAGQTLYVLERMMMELTKEAVERERQAA